MDIDHDRPHKTEPDEQEQAKEGHIKQQGDPSLDIVPFEDLVQVEDNARDLAQDAGPYHLLSVLIDHVRGQEDREHDNVVEGDHTVVVPFPVSVDCVEERIPHSELKRLKLKFPLIKIFGLIL